MAKQAKELELVRIGVIHSPFTEQKGTPIQPSKAGDTPGRVEVFPAYEQGLDDLEGLERIWLLYWCHRSGPCRLHVTPYLDRTERGLFATRAPSRPNPLGLSCVRLTARRGRILEVSGMDILDGTPLLDIKPYIPDFDVFEVGRTGWYGERDIPGSATADDRFSR